MEESLKFFQNLPSTSFSPLILSLTSDITSNKDINSTSYSDLNDRPSASDNEYSHLPNRRRRWTRSLARDSHYTSKSSESHPASTFPLSSSTKLLSTIIVSTWINAKFLYKILFPFLLLCAISSTATVDGAGELEFKTFQRLFESPNAEYGSRTSMREFCDSAGGCELAICGREFRWQFTQPEYGNEGDEWSSEKCRFGYGTTEFSFHKNLSSAAMVASSSASLAVAAGESSLKLDFTQPWEGTFVFNVRIRQKSPPQTIISERTFLQQDTLPIGAAWRKFTANFSTVADFAATVELKIQTRAICAQNYYGRKCDVRCDAVGMGDYGSHYECAADSGQLRCRAGWHGEKCNLRAEKCVNVECIHGECNADTGKCVCKNGYQGEKCDQCKTYTKCQGKCLTRPYECVCPEGRGGPNCEKDMTYCARHSPCLNGGFCANDRNGSYTCQCKLGFTGKNCENRIESCDESPCQNNAKCFTSPTNPQGFRCECAPGTYGRFCQSSAAGCVGAPCENGASCRDASPHELRQRVYQRVPGEAQSPPFTCYCASGWSGALCDTPAGWCAINTCFNGGTCAESANSDMGFACRCASGFSGPRCEWNVDDCKENPCQNSGVCVDEIAGFHCKCKMGFSGGLCQLKSTSSHSVIDSQTNVNGYRNGTSMPGGTRPQAPQPESGLPTKFVIGALIFILIALILLLAMVWHVRSHLAKKISQTNFADNLAAQQANAENNLNNNDKKCGVVPLAVSGVMCDVILSQCHHHSRGGCSDGIIAPPPYSEAILTTTSMPNSNYSTLHKPTTEKNKNIAGNCNPKDENNTYIPDKRLAYCGSSEVYVDYGQSSPTYVHVATKSSSISDSNSNVLSNDDILSKKPKRTNGAESLYGGSGLARSGHYTCTNDSVIVDMDDSHEAIIYGREQHPITESAEERQNQFNEQIASRNSKN